jgi:holo-[acyl-carrier protein] synthase
MTTVGAFTWSQVTTPTGIAAGVIRAGVDRVELDEFQRTLDVAGNRFLERTFTPEEVVFCRDRIQQFATRFAAKEAVAKALGTGFRGLGWREIEVFTSPNGEPHIVLHDRARARAGHLGVTSIGVSLTHTAIAAEAFVVVLCTEATAEQSIREEAHHG